MTHRRGFLQIVASTCAASAWAISRRGSAQVGRAAKPAPKPLPKNKEVFRTALETLKKELVDGLERAKSPYAGGLKLHNKSVDGTYRGIWPDDFLYPLMVHPKLYSAGELVRLAQFLTDSVVDLECVPDHLQPDGLPILQPGSLREPTAEHMPLHLPAAWVRLLAALEFSGVVLPRKDSWAGVIRRSFERVPFSGGLAYVDPQRPYVGAGVHDTCAITGWDLMSSLILQRGLERAVLLFKGVVGKGALERWSEQSVAIKLNLHRLWEERLGAFLAGSRDCRQVDVWANGLAYWMVEPELRRQIVAFFRTYRQRIFNLGFTRQILEPKGWQRQLVEVPSGSYVNGGFWPAGTGWVLPAIADQDHELAADITKELVENLVKFKYPEWASAEGQPSGARGFLTSLAMPMLGLTCIVEGRSFAECF